MPTKRSAYYYHHWLVQEHFGCAKADYKTIKTRNVPGLLIELRGKAYRVESLAERTAICQIQLANMFAALYLSRELAVLLLDGAENLPGFMDRVTAELEASGPPEFVQAQENALRNTLVLNKALDWDFWHGIAMNNPFVLAAGLVVLAKSEEGNAVVDRLANLCFAHGHALAEHEQSLVLTATVEQVELLLYQVEGEPEPEPEAATRGRKQRAVPAAGQKRPARRK